MILVIPSTYYDWSAADDVGVYLRQVLPQVDLAYDLDKLRTFILIVEKLRYCRIIHLVSTDRESVKMVLSESSRPQLVEICLQEFYPCTRLHDLSAVFFLLVSLDGFHDSRARVLYHNEVLEDLVED